MLSAAAVTSAPLCLFLPPGTQSPEFRETLLGEFIYFNRDWDEQRRPGRSGHARKHSDACRAHSEARLLGSQWEMGLALPGSQTFCIHL